MRRARLILTALSAVVLTLTFTTTQSATAAADTTPPTVVYIGPSEVTLNGIQIEIQDETDPDNVATEVHVFYQGAEVADFTHSHPNHNIILLDFNHPPALDGNYEVHVKPHDAAGNVGAEVIGVAQAGQQIVQLATYGDFQGGAETAAGDVDGDGVDELITAAGPGGGPHVRVFAVDYVNHTTTPVASWMAYDPKFTGGVRVGASDLDGDGTDEVLTGPGPGGGPHVRAWRVNDDGSVTEVESFMAYDPKFTAGVFVAGGDVDGALSQGNPRHGEIIVGPGSGGGPHVRVFTRYFGEFTERCGFMAYAPNFTGGVRVASADVSDDGVKEVITAAGPGGGPHVQAFDTYNNCPPHSVVSFMAFDPNFHGGVYISGTGESGNGDALLVAAGPGGGPHVRLLQLEGGGNFTTSGYSEMAGFMAYDPNFHGGVFAAGGDFDGDLDADILTTPGPGMPVISIARRWK